MVANYPKNKPRLKTTLILAPLALLPQWQQEIADKTDGSFKTIIYHGAFISVYASRLADREQGLTSRATLTMSLNMISF